MSVSVAIGDTKKMIYSPVRQRFTVNSGDTGISVSPPVLTPWSVGVVGIGIIVS